MLPRNPGGGYPYIAEEDRNGDGVVNGYERCGLACGQELTSGSDSERMRGGVIIGPLCDRFEGYGAKGSLTQWHMYGTQPAITGSPSVSTVASSDLLTALNSSL